MSSIFKLSFCFLLFKISISATTTVSYTDIFYHYYESASLSTYLTQSVVTTFEDTEYDLFRYEVQGSDTSFKNPATYIDYGTFGTGYSDNIGFHVHLPQTLVSTVTWDQDYESTSLNSYLQVYTNEQGTIPMFEVLYVPSTVADTSTSSSSSPTTSSTTSTSTSSTSSTTSGSYNETTSTPLANTTSTNVEQALSTYTVTVNGTVTLYTSVCPLTVIQEGYISTVTETLSGVLTIYTTFCPVSDLSTISPAEIVEGAPITIAPSSGSSGAPLAVESTPTTVAISSGSSVAPPTVQVGAASYSGLNRVQLTLLSFVFSSCLIFFI